jgi:hypothetical protein
MPDMKRYVKNPKWTIVYNIFNESTSRWVGEGWEFYDDDKAAQDRYNFLAKFSETPNTDGFKYCPCKRPFYSTDRSRMGAAHAWEEVLES